MPLQEPSPGPVFNIRDVKFDLGKDNVVVFRFIFHGSECESFWSSLKSQVYSAIFQTTLWSRRWINAILKGMF